MMTAEQAANNERYLAAALEWLRLCLKRRAGQPGLEPEPKAARGCNPFGARSARHAPAPRPERVTDSQIETAFQKMQLAAAAVPSPALISLSEQLGLSPFEQSVLLLCAAIELDTRIPGLCAQAQGSAGRPYPTFALAMAIFDDPPWNAVMAEGPLRYWRLIEINQSNGQPLMTSPLRIDEEIIHFIKGITGKLDRRLARVLSPMMSDEGMPLPASQAQIADHIISVLSGLQDHAPVVQLLGSDRLSKQLVAQCAAREFNTTLFRLSDEWIPDSAAELENFLRLWQREVLLIHVGLFVELKTGANDGQRQSVGRLLEECSGVVFLDTPEQWPDLIRFSVLIETTQPTPEEQEAAWSTLVGELAPNSPSQLANQFNLNLPTIHQIAQTALCSSDDSLDERLWTACLLVSRQRLDTLAHRIEIKASWDDLVLPQEEKEQLLQIAYQVKLRSRVYQQWGFPQRSSRGLGLSVLFAGESGTGKTMAAEVLAGWLRLNLYKIDLSSVVSKYIGETEKNLRMLFDAAESGGVILFFDEADALFGKRSEVKDSHDRYANIEISYLLQRMESFRGLAILATNMKSALDNAFLRRLRFVVNFPFPGRDDRKKIWEKAFPTPLYGDAPDLDYDWLARLNVTGGNIQTIALNSAFLAAQLAVPIDMALVLKVSKAEFHKLEKPVNEQDFLWKKNGKP